MNANAFLICVVKGVEIDIVIVVMVFVYLLYDK